MNKYQMKDKDLAEYLEGLLPFRVNVDSIDHIYTDIPCMQHILGKQYPVIRVSAVRYVHYFGVAVWIDDKEKDASYWLPVNFVSIVDEDRRMRRKNIARSW